MKRIAANLILSFIAMMVTSHVALAADAFNFDDAARMATESFLKLDSAAKVEREGKDLLRLKRGDGVEATVFLGNLLSTLNHDPENSAEHVEHFARVLMDSLTESPKPAAPELRATLFPMVRHKDYVEYIKSATEKESNHSGFVISPLAVDYWIILGIDTPESVSVVQREDLAELSLSDAELMTEAKTNLAARLKNVAIMESGGARMPVLDGNSEVSILAVDSFWRAQSQELKDEIVAVAPSRDVLMYCSASDTDCIARISQAALANIESLPNAVSAALIKWTGESWEPYIP